MAGPINFTSETASAAMLRGLTDAIRNELKRRVMEHIEADLNVALDAALENFKASLEAYRDHRHMRDTVRVLIERRDLAPASADQGKPI